MRLITSGFETKSITSEGFAVLDNSPSISSTIKRNGLYSLQCSVLQSVSYTPSVAKAKLYWRGYIYLAQAVTSAGSITEILNFQSVSGDTNAGVKINTDNSLQVYTDTTSSVGVSTPLTLNTWYCLEMFVDGTLKNNIQWEVRLNGSTLSIGHYDNSINTANSNIASIQFGLDANGGNATNGTLYFDDIAINDTTGLFDNLWAGALIYEPIQKRFFYKVYDANQAYVTTWERDVISDPSFRTVINGGAGELPVTLARKYDNFGEGSDVALGNRVELWIADSDNLVNDAASNTMWDIARWDVDIWDNPVRSFIRIYSGTITQYAPVVDGSEEYVDITLLGFISEASYKLLKDSSGNTTISYSGQDPSAILKDIINKYRADGGVNLNYTSSSLQSTGTTVTYTFNDVFIKDALDKVVELSPENWYYFIDGSGTIYFQQANLSVANHSLTIGKDVMYSQTTKRTENVINEVSVIGGGNPNLFNIYQRSGSISAYGKHHRKVQDGQVTDNPTADALAKRLLNMFQTPETRSVIRISDNNGENSNIGANIENFQIGDTVQLKNVSFGAKGTTLWDIAKWDNDVWDYTISYTTADVLTIVSITYTPDYIEIEASSRLPEISKELQTLNKKIDTQIQTNLPTAPVSRSV